MKLSRRSFLKIGVAGIVVAAAPPIIRAAIIQPDEISLETIKAMKAGLAERAIQAKDDYYALVHPSQMDQAKLLTGEIGHYESVRFIETPHIWTPRVGKGKYAVSAIIRTDPQAEGVYKSLAFETEEPMNLYIELENLRESESCIASNVQLERVGRRWSHGRMVDCDAKTGVVIARYRG